MAETMIPEGRGKAEAMAAFLAQGGELVSKGGTRRPGMRYTSGPMRGKTIEQAQQMFEQRWATASPAIKDKYAGRASSAGVLAPSEQKRLIPSIAPVRPLSPRPDPRPFAPVPNPTGAATPEENARAQAMLGDALGSDKYATASWGNGVDMAAAAAMGNDWMKQSEQRDNRTFQTPKLTPEEIDANSKANQPIARSSPAAMRQADEQRMQTSIAPTPPAATAPPVAAAPTPAPPSPAKPAPAPVAGGLAAAQARMAKFAPTPTGTPVMSQGEADAYKGPTSPSVNRLTGLPFGFQPGDSVQDPTMQARADQSVIRQQATNASIPKPSPVKAQIDRPAFQPETRYTPGLGNVPVAKPVTDGTEQVPYADYAAAGDRMKTPGGNSKQDSQDSALRSQFDKQAFQRQADAMRQKRLGTGRTGYTGPGMVRPLARA